MPKNLVAGLALAGLAFSPIPAYADAPVTDGLICSFTTIIDPTAEEGTQSGQLEGGPVHFGEQPDGTTADQGTLVCRVQVVDAFTSDHTGTGPAVTGHTNIAGVATAGPQAITINRTGTQNVFLCSEFVDDSDGVTYYWDDDNSEWSTSPLVHCGLSVTGDDGSDPSDDPINRIPCPIFAQLPAPLAETLQEAWGDCRESGPNNAVIVVGRGAEGILVTPPGWSCTDPTLSNVASNDSVRCWPPNQNPLRTCKEVFNTAVALPGIPPPPDDAVTIKGTTTCPADTTIPIDPTKPGIRVEATADASTMSIASLQSKVGTGDMTTGITCSWETTGGGPLAWGVVCAWNLGI